MPARNGRKKISTTVAPETATFLKALIRKGKASSMAEAVDHVVAAVRETEMRRQREAEGMAYYASLSGEALAEEKALELAMASAVEMVDFDGE